MNLPKHITSDNDQQSHEEADKVELRTREATELLTYLWENYIELNEPTHVFLMGTNTGHGAIVNFIKANEERAQDGLTKAISFVEDVPLQSCKSATNENLPAWYYTTSLVFIAEEHSFWSSEYARKIKKRFGRVFKSPEQSISDMLVAHKGTVTDMLLEAIADWQARRPANDDEDMAEMDPAAIQRNVSSARNFALSSPAKGVSLNMVSSPSLPPVRNFASPGKQQARSPRIASPPKATPVSSFTISPRQRPSRSPAR